MSEQKVAPKKIKTILVSQPKPDAEKSPYAELAKKHKIKIDFRPFIHVEGMTAAEWRQQRIQILEHTSVIFTSRNAIDHFFRICGETRVTVPETMKYFCMSEAIAFYLQKYVVYRKRKIFVGDKKMGDLMPMIKKHGSEKFLLPSADKMKEEIADHLDELGIRYTRGIFFKTMISDLSDLADIKYDMLVFFSPSGIKSLFHNFPDFVQGETRIAGFGPTTHNAIKEHGLRLDCAAPTASAPSMTSAINSYLKESNK